MEYEIDTYALRNCFKLSQQVMFSGHKRAHCVKFQVVVDSAKVVLDTEAVRGLHFVMHIQHINLLIEGKSRKYIYLFYL